MDIEPHHITTVSRRPPVGMDKPRTLADYQADLVRRFGSLPSWAELAKMENAARWQRNPVSTMARPQPTRALEPVEKATDKRKNAVADARRRILAELAEPKTADDLACRVGLTDRAVRNYLRELAEEGLVVRFFLHRCAVWRLKDSEPAKEAHRQAITVTVRGVEYASMAACARHFGISVEAVSCAARRGTLDNIGTRRRQEAAE
jgi:DNA-binding transcriptional ArsR family regulator